MNKKFLLIFLLTVFIGGCSAYKEISPNPDLIPKEDGYIKLLDGKKNFELEHDAKYYMEVTPPVKDNFYFVIKNNIKPISEYYFSDKFDGGDKGYTKIPDVVSFDKTESAYPVDSHHKMYYWIIEKVNKDTLINAAYRYVPMWRYNFEREFAKTQLVFYKYRLKRTEYKHISYNSPLEKLKSKLKAVTVSIDSISYLRKVTPQMEKYFPDSLRIAKEKAYKNYLIFSNDVEEEYIFEKKSLALLQTYVQLKETENDQAAFLKSAPVFLRFLKSKLSVDESVKKKVKEIIAKRISNVEREYFNTIAAKRDIKPFNINPPIETVYKLYKNANGFVPKKFDALVEMIKRFNKKASMFQQYKTYKKDLDNFLKTAPKWLPNTFYETATEKLKKMMDVLPTLFLADFRGFENYYCVSELQRGLRNGRRYTRRLERDYREANFIVGRLNELRTRKAYGEMLSLLKSNSELGFLIKHYKFLDLKYLGSKKNIIGIYLSSNNWESSEKAIIKLNRFNDFLAPSFIASKKKELINKFETELFTRVKNASIEKINSFVKTHLLDTENLKTLYSDSVFAPVYRLTFSIHGETTVEKRNNEISDYLEKIKYYSFPEKSVLALYQQILNNKNNNAVSKVRAIEFHSKYYRGKNRKVRNIIDEFNVNIAKLITRSTDYRKLFVVPVTNNKKGVNTYLFKVQLKIPTKAKFPVYEINIKLPEEIAKNADTQRWYDKILLNNTEIKNEGRIKIIAPSKNNNYECKITPVQMDKEEKNVLSIYFKFPSYKLYEVSVMAQKPLIRKN
jgi:hypothetical protein